MKISVLLPFKENYSPDYAGAVSLFINDTNKLSNFKNSTTIYGYTEFKSRFKSKYVNIEIEKNLFSSSNKEYVKKFISIEKKNNSDLIEIHNRPSYVNSIFNNVKSKLVLYFHNDPLEMNGSKKINDRSITKTASNGVIAVVLETSTNFMA